MSGKLSEVEGRIGTVHQLEAVITAMRGSAAARSREARARLDGIRAYAAAIGGAIGEAVALAPEPDPQLRKTVHLEGRIVIVLCAEQGFAGTFNERVLDAAEDHLKFTGSELLVIGDRGAMVAAERGLTIGWSAPMVSHVDEVPLLASRITDALYSRLANGQCDAHDGYPRRTRAFSLDRNRRTDIIAVRLHALQSGTGGRRSSHDSSCGATPCRARRGICLRGAVRGGDALLRRRKRGPHAGDDCRAQ